MSSLTIQGRTYSGTSRLMASAIQHFQRVMNRGSLTASAAAPRGKADPIAAYHRFLAMRQECGKTKAQAIREFTRDFPEDHRRFLEAYNKQHGRG